METKIDLNKKYRVVEGVINIVFTTDNKKEAYEECRTLHRGKLNEYHEVWERYNDHYSGILQFKPGDPVKW